MIWDFYSCTVVVCVCEYLISSPSKVSTEVQRDAMRVKSRVTRHLPKWMTFKLEHIVSGVISKAYPAARRDLWLHTAAGMNIQIIGVESLIFRSGETKECLNAFNCIASRHLTLRYPKVWRKKNRPTDSNLTSNILPFSFFRAVALTSGKRHSWHFLGCLVFLSNQLETFDCGMYFSLAACRTHHSFVVTNDLIRHPTRCVTYFWFDKRKVSFFI